MPTTLRICLILWIVVFMGVSLWNRENDSFGDSSKTTTTLRNINRRSRQNISSKRPHSVSHTIDSTTIINQCSENIPDDPIRQQCYMFPKINLTTDTSSKPDRHRRQQEDYVLGDLPDTPNADGIRFSKGLKYKIVARSGQRVVYTSPDAVRSTSRLSFHRKPDGADIFLLDEEDGSYVYMSNSERNIPFFAGVYGVKFDKNHQIVDYQPHIRRTTRNCNGGRTPWDTWVTCEEAYLPYGGHCWQVDPHNERAPEKLTMSGFWGGTYEAFAYDLRNVSQPSFYITEDVVDGTLRRYRPPPNTPIGWDMLHKSDGIVDYLELLPETKTFRWTTSLGIGRQSAFENYRNSEGIIVWNGILAFVSKVPKLLFLLDLDKLKYTVVSTETSTLPGGGAFDAQPDHVIKLATETNGNLLLLSEDGGPTPGLFAYDGSEYLSFFESNYDGDEVTGIAFSPDGKVMYACLQDAGYLFQISREDNQPFTNRRVLKWRKGFKL